MSTFAAVLARCLRTDPGRPLVTFYDHGTGERVELSVTTYANWVAKAAALLCDEHDLQAGDRLRLDLPTHWLGTVFLGAAWSTGLVLTDTDDPALLDGVVCGPEGVDRWASAAAEVPVLACSLRPLGAAFAEPLPPDVHDVGVEVWSQPDAFTAWDPPGEQSPALALAGTVTTQGELWRAAAVGSLVVDGGRLLSEANPASPPGVASFAEPLARGGSVVLVVGADAEQRDAVYASERATARFPAS